MVSSGRAAVLICSCSKQGKPQISRWLQGCLFSLHKRHACVWQKFYCSINTAPIISVPKLSQSEYDGASNLMERQLWLKVQLCSWTRQAVQGINRTLQAAKTVCETAAAWGIPLVMPYRVIRHGMTRSYKHAGTSRQQRIHLHQHSPSEAAHHAIRAAM